MEPRHIVIERGSLKRLNVYSNRERRQESEREKESRHANAHTHTHTLITHTPTGTDPPHTEKMLEK